MKRLMAFAAAVMVMTCIASAGSIELRQAGPVGQEESEKREIARDEDYISVTPGRRVIKRFEDVKQNAPFAFLLRQR
jgi:hypothetical protein